MGEISLSAAIALDLTKRAAEQASSKLEAKFQFDFPGLIIKLVVFFLVSFAIAKIFEGIIFGNKVVNSLAALIGINLPSTLPEPIVNFFKDGINGFRYWDIIKGIATLLVLAEWWSWYNTEKAKGIKAPSALTNGVFFVIVLGLSLITFPELFQRIKEIRTMSQGVTNG